ncbi:MAG: hypothetical protein WD359_07405 [Dehalococcoidia bacterium]
MNDVETADLLSRDQPLVARVRVSLWKRNLNGGADWGGGIEPIGNVLAIELGLYILRLSDGREAQIIINNVRVTAAVGGSVLSAATFLGDDYAPL